MAATQTRCQVVVVGAGPVGTVAATYLAQRGIDVVVLEAGPDCAQDLRASTFHPPTLELLDEIGITQTLLTKGLKAPVYHWRDRHSGEVTDFDLTEISDVTRYPFRIQCEQYHMARALAAGLENHAHAQVLFSRRLLSFEQDANGVIVHAEGAYGIESWRCDYLIGADGANSLVRKWLGIEFDGFTYPEKFLCLTTSTPLEQYLPNLAYVNYVSDPQEWLVLLRVPTLWRVLVPADAEEPDQALLSDDKKNKVFGNLIGLTDDVITEHRTIYRVHQRVAKAFHAGRVAIIGDAAHLNNPLGGFGMNSGVHDAFNLCDKLVKILKEGANADLLNVFDRQRRTVTHSFTQAQTIQNMEMMRGGQSEAHGRRRQEMKAIRDDDSRRRSYLLRQAMFESLAQAAAIN
jgi:3-(3-hydroxy-phenyl)propionate hydroxylase